MRSVLVFLLLMLIKAFSLAFYHFRGEWLDPQPDGRWSDVRVLAMLNHTSLYEPLYAGCAPPGLLWRFARHGVLPVAEKTMKRRIGLFFRFLARHVVVVTRQRDHTWNEVLNRLDTRAIVMILPEGRMMRRDGLDSTGRPMTIRGGIADILEALDDGRMCLVYSGGLHHVQVPGERLPRLFRTIGARFELVDIASYKRSLGGDSNHQAFRKAVIDDMTRRRNTLCPSIEEFNELPKYRI